MPRLSFSDALAIGGAVLGLLIVVLDKAGKLRGPAIPILLVVAALMTVPLALGNTWVASAQGLTKVARGALMLSLVGVLYSLLAIWVAPPPFAVPSSRGDAIPAAKVQTLHDLFLGDCHHTNGVMPWPLTRHGESYTIEVMYCPNPETGTFYVSFFLPTSGHTFSVCRDLPRVYKEALGELATFLPGATYAPPGEGPITWAELKPSGRVYVYHESPLFPDQITTITAEYGKAGLSPQFRGRDYAIMRNSPLYPSP